MSSNHQSKGAQAIPQALAEFDRLPDSANVDIHVVAGILSCGHSTIWARLKHNDPLIPKPRKFGRSTRFNVGELRAALAAHAAGSMP